MSISPSSGSSLDVIDTFHVNPSSSDSINTYWSWKFIDIDPLFKHSEIYYTFEGDSVVWRAPLFTDASVTQFQLKDLHTDTRYRVCLKVAKAGNLSHRAPDRICRDVTTRLWHLPASIGSSVGACLALALIVLLVLLSQRARNRRKKKRNRSNRSSKHDRVDSTYESQLDSGGNRDDQSFYDDGYYEVSFGNSTPTDSYANSQASTMFSQSGNRSPSNRFNNSNSSPLKEESIEIDTKQPLLCPPLPNNNNNNNNNSLANQGVLRQKLVVSMPSRCDSVDETRYMTPDRLSLQDPVELVSPHTPASSICPSEASNSELTRQLSNPPAPALESHLQELQSRLSSSSTTPPYHHSPNPPTTMPLDDLSPPGPEHVDVFHGDDDSATANSQLQAMGIFTQLIETL